MSNIKTVTAIRYVTPLREGGSLPAIVEADDLGTYVLKFRGAGQGPKALIAELVVGELARALGLPVPDIVFVELNPDLARTEPDPEIQDLIRASAGLNLALDYLPGSITFDPVVNVPDSQLASAIVWLDAFTTNVDRTPRNPNMLMWHKKLWLIDHGACLYFHHAWGDYLEQSRSAFPMINQHVLLPFADQLAETAHDLSSKIDATLLEALLSIIPDEWLLVDAPFSSVEEHRKAYLDYLQRRLQTPHTYIEEATRARDQLI